MTGYKKAVSREVEQRLDEAERRGRCLAAHDDSLYRALMRRRRDGLVISPFPRVFARLESWNRLNKFERSRNMLLGVHDLHPGWTFCSTSAAVLMGLQVPFAVIDRQVHVARTRPPKSRNRQVVYHDVYCDKVLDGGAVNTTSFELTAFDCMRAMGFRYGVAIADSLLSVSGMPKQQLVDYVVRRRGGFRGAPAARAAARFADARSANGGESVARAVMYELGFAVPELQVGFADPMDPSRAYYADFVWNLGCDSGGGGLAASASATTGSRASVGDGLVIGELDGVEKYFDPVMNRGGGVDGALLRERRRESRLTIARSAIVRFSFEEVLDLGYFDRLLETFGVPRDHKPLVRIPRVPDAMDERVPLEVYGV